MKPLSELSETASIVFRDVFFFFFSTLIGVTFDRFNQISLVTWDQEFPLDTSNITCALQQIFQL